MCLVLVFLEELYQKELQNLKQNPGSMLRNLFNQRHRQLYEKRNSHTPYQHDERMNLICRF